MSDYIDRQAAINACFDGWNNAADDCARNIKCIPAADVVPVVHGKWIENTVPDSMLKMCSDCGFTCGAYSFNFCPNCGAKMDGKGEE